MKLLIVLVLGFHLFPSFSFAEQNQGQGLTVAPPIQIADPEIRADFENTQRRKLGLPILLAGGGSAGTRGGGGIGLSKWKSFSEWMNSGHLNEVVASYVPKIDSFFQKLDASNVSPAEATASVIWKQMMDNGALVDDIKNSKYVPSDHCPGKSDPDTAATTMTDGRALHDTDICFDINKLITDRSTTAFIITLAFHEHTHHFGYRENGAYMVTQVVGALLDSTETNSTPLVDMIPGAASNHRLATEIKRGSQFKLIQNIDHVQNPTFQNGNVFSSFGGITNGVYCMLQGRLEPGKTAKLLFAKGDFTDVRTPNVTSTYVELELDVNAALSCERLTDDGAQITIQDVQNALEGVFELHLKF